jgi:hypothetical protein
MALIEVGKRFDFLCLSGRTHRYFMDDSYITLRFGITSSSTRAAGPRPDMVPICQGRIDLPALGEEQWRERPPHRLNWEEQDHLVILDRVARSVVDTVRNRDTEVCY